MSNIDVVVGLVCALQGSILGYLWACNRHADQRLQCKGAPSAVPVAP